MFDKIRRFSGHVIIYGFGSVGTRAVGFLLIPIYSRYLTPADYGVLALVAMFGQVLYAVMNMGQSQALFRTYFKHDDREGREAVISTSLWLILTLSLPVGVLALILAKPLSWLLTGSSAYTAWVVLGITAVMFKILLRLPLAVLRAREESRRYALATFAQTAISLVLAIVFVVGLLLGGRGVLLSQLLAEVLICLVLLPSILKGLRLTFLRRDARDLLSYGLALVPAALLSFLSHLSDRYLLMHFVSISAVGIYALGYRFGEIVYFVMYAFELAFPQFVYGHLKSPGAPALFARVCTYYLAVMGALWLVLSLLAEETVKIMAAPAYHEAYRVVPWIAGAFLFQGLGWVWNLGMHVHRTVRNRLLITGSSTVLNLALNFLLIPRFGMMGAAVAALSSFSFQCVFQLLLCYRLYPVPYEYGRIARLTVVGAGIYAVGSLIGWGSIPMALAGKALLLLSAPLLLYATGFFETGEIDRLKDLMRGFRRGSVALLQARSSSK
jgi:O-antigen/teichoic acid export membrane protein